MSSAPASSIVKELPPTLRDRICLVTGATSGIGRVAATALARMGAKVLLAGRDRGRGEAALEEIRRGGGTAEFLQADFSSLRAVRELAAEVRSRHSRLVSLARRSQPARLQSAQLD